MGGVLSLLMSTRLDVAGVVAMSTPYVLARDPRNYPVWFLKLYGRFVKFAPKSGDAPGAGWFDNDAFLSHVSYQQNPISSAAELKALLYEMRAALSEVRKPVLLIHSKGDTYVVPESMENIYNGLVNASDKTKLYVTESGHVITRDAVRNQVFEAALQFIRQVERQFES